MSLRASPFVWYGPHGILCQQRNLQVIMEESERDRDQEQGVLHRKRNGILTRYQILFSINIACAVGYALLAYISKNQGFGTPKNDSTYFFLRSAFKCREAPVEVVARYTQLRFTEMG